MGTYVNTTDFVNKFSITTNDFDAGKLDYYIDRYETITLQELFGVELYDLWVAGIAGTDPSYETLRDAFTVQLDCGLILNSRGIEDLLLGVIYYQYKTEAFTESTITSNVKSNNETAENVGLFTANIQWRYNESIGTYAAIQEYICDNLDTYPTFKGIEKPILLMF